MKGVGPTMKPVKPAKGQQRVTRSFNHAYRGLVYAVRTQRNMRFHVVAAAVVLVLSLLVGVSKLELAVLVLVIMAVFVTEMLRTSLARARDARRARSRGHRRAFGQGAHSRVEPLFGWHALRACRGRVRRLD